MNITFPDADRAEVRALGKDAKTAAVVFSSKTGSVEMIVPRRAAYRIADAFNAAMEMDGEGDDTHIEHDAEFGGDNSQIIGHAVYALEFSGNDTRATLLRVICDGLTLYRDQLVQMCGDAVICGAEESMTEKMTVGFNERKWA